MSLTVAQKNSIIRAMYAPAGSRRRQVICKYIHYSDKSEDFDWLRKLDYTVTNYPDFKYFCVSW